jgi:hypothetical protein
MPRSCKPEAIRAVPAHPGQVSAWFLHCGCIAGSAESACHPVTVVYGVENVRAPRTGNGAPPAGHARLPPDQPFLVALDCLSLVSLNWKLAAAGAAMAHGLRGRLAGLIRHASRVRRSGGSKAVFFRHGQLPRSGRVAWGRARRIPKVAPGASCGSAGRPWCTRRAGSTARPRCHLREGLTWTCPPLPGASVRENTA